MSCKRMRNILSIEEEKQKHKERSFNGMKTILNTEEGMQKHGKNLLKQRKNYLVQKKEGKSILKFC